MKFMRKCKKIKFGGIYYMMNWGNPDMSIIKQQISRQTREDDLCESQVQLNRKLTSSLELCTERDNTAVIHNHFNIIINVAPNTTNDKITSIVQQLICIVDRVN